MNAHPGMVKFVTWLLNHSLQAGVLVILVLLVQWICRGRLASRWRFALWWVVLARLLLPVGPQSAVSLFNYFHPSVSVTPHSAISQPVSTPHLEIQTADATRLNDSFARIHQMETATVAPTQPEVSHLPAAIEPSPSSGAPVPTPIRPRNFRNLILATVITLWLAGMAILSGYVLIQILRFQRRLSCSIVRAEPAAVELLRDCRREFGVTRRIELLETEAVGSPALFGLFRLRLLLPKGFTEKFSRSELRFVFLHELAHVKRGDLWLNWLITALQIAHWFNPLIWFGFARLRSDRELACDELALLHAGEKTGTCYGETVVKLLEGLSHPAAIPGLVGILEDKKQMRRRILMIANFKKPGRWSALAILLLAAIAAATLTDAQTQTLAPAAIENADASPKSVTPATISGNNVTPNVSEEEVGAGPRPDLTGEVHAKGGGPLAATVFISTAGPKTGSSTLCPSCYEDCSKSATADTDGAFDIKSLNPQLIFRVLAVAKGYKPKFVSDVDPAKGPVAIELEPVNAADATPDRSLRGRVVDKKGKPLEGATVEMIGIESKDGNGSYGALKGIDPMSVTDANGEFMITAQKPFDMMDIRVEARRLAPRAFSKLSSGTHHDLTLAEGASVTGRVLAEGKPLKSVSVGISAVDRSAGRYLGHFEASTGPDGTFSLANLPPDADFYVYTRMSTMKEFGAVPIQKFHTAADGETTNLGDLIARPAFRLQGRLVLADGQPLPPNTRLFVSREDVSDSMQLALDQNGGFDTTGIPAGVINLSARVSGYRVSPQNRSLDRLNLMFLSGRVDHDITGLVYLLEKGPTVRPDLGGGITEEEIPQNRPLRGAEGGVDHSRDWTVSGKVIDSETKEPLASFHVTPGQTDNFNRTHWESIQSVDGTNGSYLVYVNKRVAQPLLKIEADGYLPGSISLVPEDANNADLALTKGTGPSGTVVDSEGKPAAGATLVLLCDGADQVGLNSRGELTAYWNKNITATADAAGHFKIQPALGMRKVAASSSNGFAIANLEELAAHPEIRLQPFGKISGTLKRTSGPGTNEDLDLSFTDKAARGLPPINLNNHALTDSQGNFSFDRVPGGLLQLSYRVPMNEHSWRNEPLQKVDVKPGQTLDLQVNASDRISEPVDSFQPPQPKRIPGAELKGYVLLPSGAPAANADVAVQVEGVYLALGKAALFGNSPRENGLMVTTGPDGSFTLPMFEKAVSLIALNEQGIATASIEAFKASPQLTLQQWGRVEGTLEINHHPGSNETVVLQRPPWSFEFNPKNGTNKTDVASAETGRASVMYISLYNMSAFQAKTDEHGHFAISFIPPGEAALSRGVPLNDERNATVYRPLGTVNVKAGETTIANFASEGRTVTGKLKLTGTNTIDLEDATVTLVAPFSKLLLQLQSARTAEERQAILDSADYQSASRNRNPMAGTLRPDGSFRADEVPPGTYELSLQPGFRPGNRPSQMPAKFVMYTSARNIVVPPASDKEDSPSFDAGTIELQCYSIPTFPSPAEKP